MIRIVEVAEWPRNPRDEIEILIVFGFGLRSFFVLLDYRL
jgi:hypothetical protein